MSESWMKPRVPSFNSRLALLNDVCRCEMTISELDAQIMILDPTALSKRPSERRIPFIAAARREMMRRISVLFAEWEKFFLLDPGYRHMKHMDPEDAAHYIQSVKNMEWQMVTERVEQEGMKPLRQACAKILSIQR